MEEGIGSWYDQQQNNGQSHNFNILNARYCTLGQQSTFASYINPCSNYVSTNGIIPVQGSSGVPRASEHFESRGRFHCLNRFCQAFTPVLNSASPLRSCGDPVASNSQNAMKRYLVSDQSGDQTTLIFSSGISGPVDNMPSWRLKPSNGFTLYKESPESKKEASSSPSRMYSHNGFNEQDYETDVRSEMHEDTEELDALLYSNDEEDYSEDEEASTGHSPSTPDNDRVWFDNSGEEVSTSARPAKKQRVYDGDHDVPSLMDTASSLKSHRCFKHEGNAESSYGNRNNMLVESDSVSADQRSKIENIHKTISILESIIPGEKGKDTIGVIDDAIHYLQCLKDKAKVLGLDGH